MALQLDDAAQERLKGEVEEIVQPYSEADPGVLAQLAVQVALKCDGAGEVEAQLNKELRDFLESRALRAAPRAPPRTEAT